MSEAGKETMSTVYLNIDSKELPVRVVQNGSVYACVRDIRLAIGYTGSNGARLVDGCCDVKRFKFAGVKTPLLFAEIYGLDKVKVKRVESRGRMAVIADQLMDKFTKPEGEVEPEVKKPAESRPPFTPTDPLPGPRPSTLPAKEDLLFLYMRKHVENIETVVDELVAIREHVENIETVVDKFVVAEISSLRKEVTGLKATLEKMSNPQEVLKSFGLKIKVEAA